MSSLTSGGQVKRSRLWRIGELLSGCFMYVRSGGEINVNSGGRVVVASSTAIFRVVPGVKPGTCTVGDICADSADGNKLYQCTATNTWTKVGTQA